MVLIFWGEGVGVEHIPKEIKTFITFINKSTVVRNIFRIQGYDLVICGYFCIRFIDFVLKVKGLLTLPILVHQMILKK